MAQPWTVLDKVETEEGVLELRQRGARDFLITIGTQVLMNSLLHRSEMALGELACRRLREAEAPRVLIGGLGMAFTLRAVLDQLPATAEVVVAELNPVVVRWCQGPLAALTSGAVNDPRVKVEIGDVAAIIRKRSRSAERFDAVVFDLYRGPHAKTDKIADPLYGSVAIEATRSLLKPGGTFAIWGENYDEAFDKRLQAAGFSVSTHRPGRGGLRHMVFLAEMKPQAAGAPEVAPSNRSQPLRSAPVPLSAGLKVLHLPARSSHPVLPLEAAPGAASPVISLPDHAPLRSMPVLLDKTASASSVALHNLNPPVYLKTFQKNLLM